MKHFDIVIIGAGAAGLMAGATAGLGNKTVLILDHAKKAGEKIRISGGGRCNFTNTHSDPRNFISQNPHFCKSALAGYGPQDFITLVESYGIDYHEKTQTGMQLGQLFCDGKSQQIIDMLLDQCRLSGNEIWLNTAVEIPDKVNGAFQIQTSKGLVSAKALVVACGGPSIPKMGASGFGYKIAEHFDMRLTERRPALVPLTFTDKALEPLADLSGLAMPARVSLNKTSFDEAVLLTHRGLSGPAILQISSYWQEGQEIMLNLAPDIDILTQIKDARHLSGKISPASFLQTYLPARFSEFIASHFEYTRLADMSLAAMEAMAEHVNHWILRPAGTEGYRKAEVTLGGVDTSGLESKTLESKSVSGLYFIGEVVDVTGHLGGHNFQWAWSSAVAAGRALA